MASEAGFVMQVKVWLQMFVRQSATNSQIQELNTTHFQQLLHSYIL